MTEDDRLLSENESLCGRLCRLSKASLHIAEDLDGALQEIADEARSLTGASYAVIATLAECGEAERYTASGLSANDAQRLITDLLDVARIEVGALSVRPQPTEVAALVDSARNTFLSGGNRHDIRVDLSPDLPRVAADRRRIVQVLDNLLSNAAARCRRWATSPSCPVPRRMWVVSWRRGGRTWSWFSRMRGDRPSRCSDSSRTTHGAEQAVDACRYFGGLIVGALGSVEKATLLSLSSGSEGRRDSGGLVQAQGAVRHRRTGIRESRTRGCALGVPQVHGLQGRGAEIRQPGR